MKTLLRPDTAIAYLDRVPDLNVPCAAAPGDHTAPVVVLLHGMLVDHRVWGPMAALLPGYRIVAPDMRGHGQTASGDLNTLQTVVEDTVALIDELGLDRPLLVGSSIGGIAAVEVAHHRPDLIRGAVMIGAFGHATADAGSFQSAMAAFIEALGRDLCGTARQAMPTWLGPFGGAVVTDWLVRMAESADPRSIPDLAHSVLGWDPRPFLATIPLPLHWALGEHDNIPIDVLRHDAALTPGARLTVLPAAGHLPQIETPGMVADLIEAAHVVGCGAPQEVAS